MDAARAPLLKGDSQKTIKRRRKKFEHEVIGRVRAHDVARDGYCRWEGVGLGPCDGPSEWAHWGEWKRFKTRGRSPEERHTVEGTLMMCKGHHEAYDRGVGGQLEIGALTDRFCDGRLRAARNGRVYEEPTDASQVQ